MNWLQKIFRRKNKYKTFTTGDIAVEAFRHNGKVYYHFEDTSKAPAGRTLCALAIYEELRMRCTREYLEKHIRATEILLNGGEKGRVDLVNLALINANLKERLALAPYPDHIYKLASVTFFDETESPFSYDFVYNQKKIEEWKKDPELLNFFLTTPFKDLMPSLSTSGLNAQTYFNIAEQINKIHASAYPANISKTN
jgi:hypothetical protein